MEPAPTVDSLRLKQAIETHFASNKTRVSKTPERATRGSTFETHGTLLSDSPSKNNTHTQQRPRTVAKMRSVLEAELSGGVHDINPSKNTPNNTIYSSFRDPLISKFIETCKLYNTKTNTWTALKVAEARGEEKCLYNPLKTIIHGIFKYIKPPRGEYRWIKDTHNIRMSHIEGGDLHEEDTTPGDGKKKVSLKSSPDLSILGNGSHLGGDRTQAKAKELSYRYCLCPVEIKTRFNYNKKEIVTQAGVYARQCFIYQPNRRYVPVVVIVGSTLYLHIYDRSGVLRSKAIDIHKDPHTFVRIILGVSTAGHSGPFNPKFSPFDPRIRWSSRARHPTITVTNEDYAVEYEVTGTKFSRKAIRGRGTYCANATGEVQGHSIPVLIKDAWRSSGRPAEYEFSDRIKGLDGVGQILAWDEDEPTVNALRQHIMATFNDDKAPRDRVFSRLVLEAYGPSIRFFSSQLELLQALYDAVVGHKNLWIAGILHRDVSVDNVLLGREKAKVGNRGVLIDFDMAIDVNRAGRSSQYRTGTRAFQSVAVLTAGEWAEFAPPQDHLDDLESYLYVLAWICIKYDNTQHYRNLDYLDKWEDADADTAAGSKLKFLTSPTTHLTEYFNTLVFRGLITALAEFCFERYRQKARSVHLLKEEAEEKRLLEEDAEPCAEKENDESASDDKKETKTRLQKIHEASKDGQDHDKFLAIIAKAIALQTALEKIRKEEKRVIPDESPDSPIETNVEFVKPADTKAPEACTPPDSPGTPNSDGFVEPALPPFPRPSAPSLLPGMKRSHAESECMDEPETGSATKKMKKTTTISSVPAPTPKRRSTRLTAKKSVPEIRHL